MDDKVLFENMKDFFGVNSLEDVAEKLGYARSTATTWRSKGLTSAVKLKFATLNVNKVIKPCNNKVELRYYDEVTASAGYGSENYNANFIPIAVSKDFLEKVLNVPFKNMTLLKFLAIAWSRLRKAGIML